MGFWKLAAVLILGTMTTQTGRGYLTKILRALGVFSHKLADANESAFENTKKTVEVPIEH